MVGDSPAMKNVFELIRRIARTDAPVMITGESGTGKELAARAIHERSSRGSHRFVAINCAALPANLIASELFGYEKGAFTGAYARKIGQIEMANGGTLFLDEIGDLPLDLQGHLLRFLEERKIVRVGGHNPINVDARIVSATNVDLPKAIAGGHFREDLFYRLNVLTLPMPPLRERGSDIELLAAFFLRRIAIEFGRDVTSFSPDALRALRAHRWTGNVREMIAAIRRAVVMGNTPAIIAEDLGLEPARQREGTPPANVQAATSRSVFARPRPGSDSERQAVLSALANNDQNVTHAAQELGISRITLYRMLYRHGLMSDRQHGHGEG
jgi:transcriptional regulator with PAS, ATPase and Fis domain